MNLIKKLTGIILIILYTLRIKKKPKVDNTDLNQLLQTAIDTKPKDEDQALIDSVIKDYKDKSQGQTETDYLLSSDANKERLLESVASIRDRVQADRDDKIVTVSAEIKEKVEARQEAIESKVEETKKKFDQKKCASVIKANSFQAMWADRNKRLVDNLKEKQAKGKKLNRKERNRLEMYNKHNAVNTTNSNDVLLQQQTMTNLLLVSAVDDTPVSVQSFEEPKPSKPEYTGSGGSFGGGGASSSWETPSSSYSSSRDDDRSWSGSSSSSSSSSSYDSGSSSSYDSGS